MFSIAGGSIAIEENRNDCEGNDTSSQKQVSLRMKATNFTITPPLSVIFNVLVELLCPFEKLKPYLCDKRIPAGERILMIENLNKNCAYRNAHYVPIKELQSMAIGIMEDSIVSQIQLRHTKALSKELESKEAKHETSKEISTSFVTFSNQLTDEERTELNKKHPLPEWFTNPNASTLPKGHNPEFDSENEDGSENEHGSENEQ